MFAGAGCGGSKPAAKAPPIESAQGFADDFVHRLVVVGDWDAVAADVPPLLTRQVRSFQETLRRDGVRKVRGPGELRHDCPANPSAGAGKDCFAYRLSGRQVLPLHAVTLNARFRLWVAYEDGLWHIATYDYDLIPS